MTARRILRRLRAIAITVGRASPVVRCDQCRHWFMRYDKRAYVFWDAIHDTYCPVCSLFAFGDGEAWAIWNECQGVCTDAVFGWRAEADAELLKPEWDGCDCTVVPVSVLRVPEWHEDMRAFDERARCRAEAAQR